MSATRFGTLALAAALLAGTADAALLEAEKKIAGAVDAAVPEGLALLERAVNVNSGTMHFEGVREVAELFAPELRKLGFATQWVNGAAWERAGHLLADREGAAGGKHVLLIGHLDTVFEPDSPFQRFAALSDSMARGPGIIDMKGGIVVMLLALRALAGNGALDELSIEVVLTGDEEKSGRPLALARQHLMEAGERADVALGFEDGDGDPRHAVTARRGAERWTLRTAGKPAHSSLVFREDVGSGAIYEAARILAAFHDELGGEEHLTLNPGVVVGGTSILFDEDQARGTAFGKVNVVAESTFVSGDLRALTVEQRDRAVTAMRRIVSEHYPHATAEIVFDEGYPPMAPSPGNVQLLELLSAASRDLGLGPVDAVNPAKAGAADISFIAADVDMALDGLGLRGKGGHTMEETADLRTLASQAKRIAILLYRL
jgi:glutamate carboxypeptidase